MQKIAVYGSLRPGHYNYKRLDYIYPGCLKHLSTHEIQGFTMFDLGAYPGIVRNELVSEEKIYNTITVDILECSEQAFAYIQAMESGAGYEEDKIAIDDHECTIFYLDFIPDGADQVETGDWSSYEKV